MTKRLGGALMPVMVCQKWVKANSNRLTTYEDVEIPNGYSLHLTMVHFEEYLNDHYPTKLSGVAQEYPKPSGEPYFCRLDDYTFDAVQLCGGNMRLFSSEPPAEISD